MPSYRARPKRPSKTNSATAIAKKPVTAPLKQGASKLVGKPPPEQKQTFRKKALGAASRKASQSTKRAITKKIAKSTIKNTARASSLGTSVAVEAAIALFSTKTGRRVLIGLCVAAMMLGIFVMLAPAIIVSTFTSSAGQIIGSATQQSETTALQSTPGMPKNLPPAVLKPFLSENDASGVPWQVLLAIVYYESLDGRSVANQQGSCPPTSQAPYCPMTSTTPAPPVKGAVGPFGLSAKALKQDHISFAVADNLTSAVQFVGATIASTLSSQQVPQSASLTSGIIETQHGPQYTQNGDQQAYTQVMLSALAKLPLAGQSATLDKNIYYLAQQWAVGTTTPAQSGGFGSSMVCAVGNSKTVTIIDNNGSPMTLTSQQVANAAIIVHTAQSMGIPQRGMVIGIMTALQESSLFDYPNWKIPSSFSNPNVQLGGYTVSNPPGNGTSLGLFQQQNNWGTVAQRMNPSFAAAHFFRRMEGVAGWQSLPLGKVAQKVQASAYPSAYAPWQQGASTLVGAVLGIKCSTNVNTANLTGTAKTVITAAQQFVGNTPYVWGGGTSLGPSMGLNGQGAVGPAGYQGKPGFDCSGLTLYAYAKAGITLPHYSGLGGQFSIVEHSPTFTTSISKLQPGDLVFFVGQGDGGTRANPGHVGIYIGNGKMIDAPTVGQFVSIDPVTQSSAGGFVGGGMP
ncbi:MAG: C40 family peptidase [Ferrimicrobium acidiphilum]